MLHGILLCLAVLAFLSIALEEVIHINKAKTTLLLGTLSWILLFAFEPSPAVTAGFQEGLLEVAQLWLFLLAAMTFVAYLNQHGMVEGLVYRLLPKRLPERSVPFIVVLFCFVLSSFADNITATLVAVALILSLQLEQAKNIKLAVLAVFGINSGGAALITGDVTTLMIFNAGKVGILDLMQLVPAGLISCILLACMMLPGFKGDVRVPRQRKQTQLLDKVIGIIFLLTIFLTLIVNSFIYIPPLLVFLFGLSLVFLLVHWVRHDPNDIPIMDYIRKIEFDTLLFFLGVLLLVGMLKEIGTLDLITQLYTVLPNTMANYAIGLCSAVLDNVPLTAAVLGSELNMPLDAWLGLTYSVGVGGSMLAIGSAAGIIVMSKVQGVTFGSYLRYFPHLLIAYTTGFTLVNVL